MVNGSNRKKKRGEWSKYQVTAPNCEHEWRNGSLADGWQKCALCDAVRRYVPPKA